MTLKILPAVLAVIVAACLPFDAQAQDKEQDKAVPKPTKAAAQRVVEIIRADKAKSKVYCDMADLGDKIDKAYQNKDEKTVDALSQKMDDMSASLGPEYVALMDGLQELEPDLKEAQAIGDMFEPLELDVRQEIVRRAAGAAMDAARLPHPSPAYELRPRLPRRLPVVT